MCCLPSASLTTKAEGTDVRYVRCIVRGFDDKYIYVSAEDVLGGAMLAADYTADDLTYLSELLREGMQLNLLDCSLKAHAHTAAARAT